MKNIGITLILALFALSGAAQQKLNLQIGTGVGSYKQDDLKLFQSGWEGTDQWYGIDLKTIDNFPMYFHYTGEASCAFNAKLKAGIIYRFESTGYKSSYADYSGHVQFEQLLRVHEAGILLQYRVMEFGKFAVHIQQRTYYAFTSVKLKSHFDIHNVLVYPDESQEIKSHSWMLNPGFEVSYQLFEQIGLHLGGGYNIDLKGKLNYQDKTIPGLKSDWSGVRINAAISYTF